MTDLRQHYAAVRARLNRVPVKAPPPPPAAPPTDLEMAIARHRSLLTGCPLPRRLQLAILHVLEEADLPWSEVMSRRRNPKLLEARREVFRLLTEEGWSLKRIGEAVGRDHTTVMHALRGKPGSDRRAQS